MWLNSPLVLLTFVLMGVCTDCWHFPVIIGTMDGKGTYLSSSCLWRVLGISSVDGVVRRRGLRYLVGVSGAWYFRSCWRI
jgi:hypothetical protein